jgi:hypothetical protein
MFDFSSQRLKQILIKLFFEELNDSNRSLTIREDDDEAIFEMILRHVQSEIEFYYFFEVDRDLNDRFQISLFLVHHDKDHSRH